MLQNCILPSTLFSWSWPWLHDCTDNSSEKLLNRRFSIFDCAFRDPFRMTAKTFVGSRNITPSDVQDLLWRPYQCPIPREWPMQTTGASLQCQYVTQSFYHIVEDILRYKEQDKWITETEANQCRVADWAFPRVRTNKVQ